MHSFQIRILIPLFSILLVAACSHAPKVSVHPDYARLRPRWVAVLPVQNSTGSKITAPSASVLRTVFDDSNPLVELRAYMAYQLLSRGFKVQEIETTDTLLDNIPRPWETPPKELAKILKVDAVLTPELVRWNSDFLEVNNRLLIDTRLRLVSGETGEVLWDAENPSKTIRVRAPSAGMNYRIHIQRLVDQTFSSLPKGI